MIYCQQSEIRTLKRQYYASKKCKYVTDKKQKRNQNQTERRRTRRRIRLLGKTAVAKSEESSRRQKRSLHHVLRFKTGISVQHSDFFGFSTV